MLDTMGHRILALTDAHDWGRYASNYVIQANRILEQDISEFLEKKQFI